MEWTEQERLQAIGQISTAAGKLLAEARPTPGINMTSRVLCALESIRLLAIMPAEFLNKNIENLQHDGYKGGGIHGS